jgi:hypothetical protein
MKITKDKIKSLINKYTYNIEDLSVDDKTFYVVTVEEYPLGDPEKAYWPAYISGADSTPEKAIKAAKEILEDYMNVWFEEEDWDCFQEPILK